MYEAYRVETPEAVDLGLQVAGIGTRGLAALIDTFCIASYSLVLVYGAVAVGFAASQLRFGSALADLAIVLLIFGSFLLIFGYYVLLETIWDGQTIGKRSLKLRVVKTNGEPIGFWESFIRNTVRLVDFLPAFYGVGVVTMFISTPSRRLGDFAAGTLVIRQKEAVVLADVQAGSAVGTAPTAARGQTDPDELRWDLHHLSPEEVQVARTFVQRAPSLPDAARGRLGSEIAGRVAREIGAREPYDAEVFLRRVLALRDLE